MASARFFESIPPFPDDVIVADVHKVSLHKLMEGDQAESKAMFDACCRLGFFFLDLHTDALGESMMQEIDSIMEIMRATMELSIDEKTKFQVDIPRDFFGWKAEGVTKTETGAPDRCEFFNLSQDDLLGTNASARPTPSPISTRSAVLRSYIEHAQSALTVILQQLALHLGLPRDQLRALQEPHRPSGTMLRMLRYPASPQPEHLRTSFQPHTDIGTVTLLVNLTGGLQVLAPGYEPTDPATAAWHWVRPQPGCLTVNLGDAMVEWTGGVLRSNVHRVSYAPGEQRFVERYSLALLARPYKEASMQRLVGRGIPTLADDRRTGWAAEEVGNVTAEQWEVQKFVAMTHGHGLPKSRGGRPPPPLAASG